MITFSSQCKCEENSKKISKEIYLPSQSYFGTGHGAWVVFEYEPPGAPNVRFDVAPPLQLRYIEVKCLLVVGVKLGEQSLHVRVLEVPLVRGEEF